MSVRCKICGNENSDDALICSNCGNMLINIFDGGNRENDTARPEQQKNEKALKPYSPDSESEIIKERHLSNGASQKVINNDMFGTLNEYIFRIDGLVDIEEFAVIEKKRISDGMLNADEKTEILEKLKKRAREVFRNEIRYYEDKGTFTGNLKYAFFCFIAAIILSAILPPLGGLVGIICIFFLCRAVARLFTFKKTSHAANIVKRLKEHGLYDEK